LKKHATGRRWRADRWRTATTPRTADAPLAEPERRRCWGSTRLAAADQSGFRMRLADGSAPRGSRPTSSTCPDGASRWAGRTGKTVTGRPEARDPAWKDQVPARGDGPLSAVYPVRGGAGAAAFAHRRRSLPPLFASPTVPLSLEEPDRCSRGRWRLQSVFDRLPRAALQESPMVGQEAGCTVPRWPVRQLQ
jgi:hypothetical protein